jgi:succinate dehydrogenase / fumarate reductase cytochrome b subunit
LRVLEMRQNRAAAQSPDRGAAAQEPTMTNPNPAQSSRPRIRNIHITDLVHYKLPIPGIVSILHRVSGLLMFLLLPLALWLFEASLSSETSFDRFLAFSRNGLARLVLLGLGWALLHHLCAGVRFLLLDLHIGTERAAARRSSWVVFAVSVPLTLLYALFLFGAF